MVSFRDSGVQWKQGLIWISIFPPFDEDSIFYTRRPISRADIVNGPLEGFHEVERRAGGVAPDTFEEFASFFEAAPDV